MNGKWEINDDGDRDFIGNYDVWIDQPDDDGEGSNIIAACFREHANLISAAPDLLGAMRFILAFYEPGQTHLDTEAWKVAHASAKRAVAKAEGRSDG